MALDPVTGSIIAAGTGAVLNGIFGGGGGGGSQQTTELPEFQRAALERLYGQAEGAFDATSPLTFEQAIALNNMLQGNQPAFGNVPGATPGGIITPPTGAAKGISGRGTPVWAGGSPTFDETGGGLHTWSAQGGNRVNIASAAGPGGGNAPNLAGGNALNLASPQNSQDRQQLEGRIRELEREIRNRERRGFDRGDGAGAARASHNDEAIAAARQELNRLQAARDAQDIATGEGIDLGNGDTFGGGGGLGLGGGLNIDGAALANDPVFNPNLASLDAATPGLANLDPLQQEAIQAQTGLGRDLLAAAQGGTPTGQAGTDLRAGFDASRQLAGELSGVGNEAISLGQSTLRGDFLNPESNPYIRDTVDAMIRPVMEQYQESIRPGIQSAAIQGGAYGGDREGLVQAQAARDITRNLGDISSRVYFQNFANERQLQQQAPNLLNAGVSLNQISPEMLIQLGQLQADTAAGGIGQVADAGTALRNFEQQRRDAIRAAFEAKQTKPFERVQRLAPVIQGNQAGSTTTTTNQPNAGAEAIRAALAGANLGDRLFGNSSGGGNSGGFQSFGGYTRPQPLPSPDELFASSRAGAATPF